MARDERSSPPSRPAPVPARRTALLMTGNWHEAEDLTQTALSRLYVTWPRVRVDDQTDPTKPAGHRTRHRLANRCHGPTTCAHQMDAAVDFAATPWTDRWSPSELVSTSGCIVSPGADNLERDHPNGSTFRSGLPIDPLVRKTKQRELMSRYNSRRTGPRRHPPGWTPPAGWTPDPAWGPAPEGWEFWVLAPVAEPINPGTWMCRSHLQHSFGRPRSTGSCGTRSFPGSELPSSR